MLKRKVTTAKSENTNKDQTTDLQSLLAALSGGNTRKIIAGIKLAE